MGQLVELENYEYNVKPNLTVKVELLFQLGDHQFSGLSASTRQAKAIDRDPTSFTLITELERVMYQDLPDFALLKHPSQWKKISALTTEAEAVFTNTKSGEVVQNRVKNYVNRILRPVYGNISSEPLFAQSVDRGAMQNLHRRFIIPPVMHNCNKLNEAGIQLIHLFVTDAKAMEFWEKELEGVSVNAKCGKISVNMRKLRELVNRFFILTHAHVW